MKIAYIEFNLVHDEIQPTFYYIANKLNYEIDFYIPEINSKRDIFCKCKNVNIYKLNYKNPHAPIQSPSLPIEKNWENYDLIIMGTGEPVDRIHKLMSIKNKNGYPKKIKVKISSFFRDNRGDIINLSNV